MKLARQKHGYARSPPGVPACADPLMLITDPKIAHSASVPYRGSQGRRSEAETERSGVGRETAGRALQPP